MDTTSTASRPVFQSLHLLALVGVRESGADGYTLYALDPSSGLSVESSSSGWTVPGATRDGVQVLSVPLRTRGVETARLVFGFLDAEIPPHSQLALGRIMEAVEAVWDFSQRAETYADVASRVAQLELELASSKINDRARGLLDEGDKGADESDTVGTLLRHIETVLRPRPSGEFLEQLLRNLEEELAARELTTRAKTLLQNTQGMSEEEAHHHLRITSRRSRRSVMEIARDLIEARR